MKILVLNYEYPPLGGGAGVIARYIAEGLAERGHELSVLTAWFPDLETDTREKGVRVIRLKSKRKHLFRSHPAEMMSWVRKAKKYLRSHLNEEKYDICFAHFALPGGDVAYHTEAKSGLPYVLISHGHDIPWFFPKQMFWYHLLTYHWIHRIVINSKALFVQSDAMEKNAGKFLGKKYSHLIRQIPNGWDADRFYPDYNKRSKKFTVLFPGRLVKQKDPFSFLNAISILREELPEIQVEILGDGPLRAKMEHDVKKQGLDSVVTFRGWVDKKSMLEAYQRGSLVVLPSLDEGMSIATLEALACGQYVIVTDVSRNARLITPGVNGELAEKRNPQDLAARMSAYYHEKFLNNYQIPEEQLKTLKDIYDWKQVVKEYEEALEEIVRM